MADNYTQFSVMLPFPDDRQKVTEFTNAWEDEAEVVQNDPELSDSWWESYGGFEYQWSVPEGVWVHEADGNGNVEAAAGFIQRYLKDLNIKGAVYMSWANTCSKPRINEFDGGPVPSSPTGTDIAKSVLGIVLVGALIWAASEASQDEGPDETWTTSCRGSTCTTSVYR